MKRALSTLIALCLLGTVQALDLQRVTNMAHPRLILREGDMAAVQRAVLQDAYAAKAHRQIELATEQIIKEPTSERIKHGKRLLSVSREVLRRVSYCAYMYLYSGNISYARRAEQEMLAAARFSDWNPSHFLDVGEMTAALALGYDWLYDVLSEDSRRAIASAIVEKGLNPGLGRRSQSNNWGQVCNAGLAMGAIAIAERNPMLAEEIIAQSIRNFDATRKFYAPNGIYPEGYGYWEYGTWYHILMVESLRSAGIDTAGLDRIPGLLRSAQYMDYMVAPSGRTFNFSDSGGGHNPQMPLLYWFANEMGDNSVLWHERQRMTKRRVRASRDRMLAVAMLFVARCDLTNIPRPTATFWSGDGPVPLIICRDKDSYLAAKGGSPRDSHAHMDGGSFVYEARGVRWAVDLGSQNYYSLEKRGVKLWSRGQDAQRWDVFRLGPVPHNTLTVNGKKHIYNGRVKLLATFNEAERRGGQFDLTSILFDVERAVRTFEMESHAKACITDEVTASNQTCNIRWTMSTNAKVTILNRREALLEQSGKTLRLVVAKGSCPTKISVTENTPPHDYDVENKNSRRVCIDFKVPRTQSRTLRVELQPYTAATRR